jgi:hypothetical protein
MEPLIVVLIAVAIAIALFIPFRMPARKNRKKRYRGGLGPAFGAINEIFNPSAQNASIILEEKKSARKATPAAEDSLDKTAK